MPATTPYIPDTIAARATAQGKGGIGIIRVSGPLATGIAREVIGQLPPSRYATRCDFLGADKVAIDSGIALYFPKPNSFTGEDIIEFQGHGGPLVLDLLLRRMVALGARVAMPGEFSQRAFLNNKLDLTQAEAIADLINSGSEQAARGAMRSLKGDFSRLLDSLLAEVIELRVLIEATIDFPDEELDGLGNENVVKRLQAIASRIETILRQAGQGALLAEGASVVLAGKPNAGKSSLMNRLTGQDTAIVTDIPGTTRDLVDEQLQLGGIPLRLTDTAGIRDSQNPIEAEGVRRAVNAVTTADLVLAVLDATLDHSTRVAQLEELQQDAPTLIVLNKIDLVAEPTTLLQPPFAEAICLSCKTGTGLDRLQQALLRLLGLSAGQESTFTARTRHVTALHQAASAIAAGQAVMATSRAGELLAEELRACQQALAEITGTFSTDDLLGEIFSSFCIGK